jgi:hypothetical protein
VRKFIYLLSILGFIIFSDSAISEQLVVSMSFPGEHGKLNLDHVKGSIKVTGYDGDVVLIKAELRTENKSESGNNLRKVEMQDMQISAIEKNNEITIYSNSQVRIIDLDIQLPYYFDLNINNREDGIVEVDQVLGELVISNKSDAIILNNINGPAILSTDDGEIEARFNEIPFDLPMAFTTISGNINIFLPETSRAVLKMKSEYGEIFTDFNLKTSERKIVQGLDEETGASRISLDEWTNASINGGGPQILLKTHHGNIFIRSDKFQN